AGGGAVPGLAHELPHPLGARGPGGGLPWRWGPHPWPGVYADACRLEALPVGAGDPVLHSDRGADPKPPPFLQVVAPHLHPGGGVSDERHPLDLGLRSAALRLGAASADELRSLQRPGLVHPLLPLHAAHQEQFQAAAWHHDLHDHLLDALPCQPSGALLLHLPPVSGLGPAGGALAAAALPALRENVYTVCKVRRLSQENFKRLPSQQSSMALPSLLGVCGAEARVKKMSTV
ncbi:unnamed protein product, partial [Effrenium voratum]